MYDDGTRRTGASPPQLTDPMRDMLWRVAQHEYGWTHVSRYGGGLQVGDALVRRGLVEWGRTGATIPIRASSRRRTARRRSRPAGPSRRTSSKRTSTSRAAGLRARA